jgi:hypothetical protein
MATGEFCNALPSGEHGCRDLDVVSRGADRHDYDPDDPAPAGDSHEHNAGDHLARELGQRDGGAVASSTVRFIERRRSNDRDTVARDPDGRAGDLFSAARCCAKRLAGGNGPHASDGK